MQNQTIILYVFLRILIPLIILPQLLNSVRGKIRKGLQKQALFCQFLLEDELHLFSDRNLKDFSCFLVWVLYMDELKVGVNIF